MSIENKPNFTREDKMENPEEIEKIDSLIEKVWKGKLKIKGEKTLKEEIKKLKDEHRYSLDNIRESILPRVMINLKEELGISSIPESDERVQDFRANYPDSFIRERIDFFLQNELQG